MKPWGHAVSRANLDLRAVRAAPFLPAPVFICPSLFISSLRSSLFLLSSFLFSLLPLPYLTLPYCTVPYRTVPYLNLTLPFLFSFFSSPLNNSSVNSHILHHDSKVLTNHPFVALPPPDSPPPPPPPLPLDLNLRAFLLYR